MRRRGVRGRAVRRRSREVALTALPEAGPGALRVLLHTDSTGVGGAEISLANLLRALPADVDACLVATSPQVLHTLAEQVPGTRGRVIAPSFLAALRAVRRLRPHVVHVNRASPWAGATMTAAALGTPGVRVVTVDQLPLRTTAAPLLWRTRALTLRVDAAVAVGTASARRLEDFYALGRGSVHSVPNGVPPVDRRVRPPGGELVVGSLGRLDPMKGFDVALDALARVEGIRLVVYGEGEGRAGADLRRRAVELGVDGRVQWRPWTTDRAGALGAMDVFLLPSRTEGFPLSLAEAMSAGLPAVASAVGGIPEALDDGRCGLLVPAGDSVALAAALARLRDDPDLRRRLGAAGQARARERYTDAAMAEAYVALWRQVVAARPVPRLHVPTPRP